MAEPLVVLVTGARKGIGRALAEHYLARGDTVVGMSREPSDLAAPGYRHYCADVCDESRVREALSEIRREFGRLDALVNNAGIAAMNHALLTPLATVDAGPRDQRGRDVPLLPRGREADAAAALRADRELREVAMPLQLEGEAIYAASKAAVVDAYPDSRPRAGRLRHHGQRGRADAREDGSGPSVPPATMDRLVARQAIPASARRGTSPTSSTSSCARRATSSLGR